MKKIVFAALLLIISLPVLNAQSFDKNRMDSLFNLLAEKNKAMGSLAIARNGKIVYSRAIGYSSILADDQKTSNTSTKYRIGSISKMFTSAMIFQLIEKGKLSLSSTLDTWFPELPNAKQITIGQMLNHRSGLHSVTDDSTYLEWNTQPKTHEEIIAMIAKSKPEFQPGEKGAYSNSNYILLGYIIEKITGKPYAKNLSEKITSKLGMKNTYIGGPAKISDNESYSYNFVNKWNQESETDMSIPGGAGAIVSTPTDLVTFITALFSGKLVSDSSLKQMKTITGRFGMGMFQIPFYDKIAFGHNGGIDGFTSSLAYFPEDSVAIAYTSNGEVFKVNNILIGVLSIYFGKPYEMPVFATITVKPGDLDQYLGTYASEAMPLKITVTREGATLMAQATGQPSFALEAVKKDVFKFDPAGLVMEFTPASKQFTLRQGGGVYTFTKE